MDKFCTKKNAPTCSDLYVKSKVSGAGFCPSSLKAKGAKYGATLEFLVRLETIGVDPPAKRTFQGVFVLGLGLEPA